MNNFLRIHSTILRTRSVSVGRASAEVHRHAAEIDRRAQLPRREPNSSGALRDKQQFGKISSRGATGPRQSKPIEHHRASDIYLAGK